MYWLMNANQAPANAPGGLTQLEWYFGGLAVFALVMMWLWLWLRTRGPLSADAENKA